MTRIFFRWAHSPGSEDEEARVAGNCKELGDWQPVQGLPLTRIDAEESCCFVSKGVVLPMGKQVEYLYAICRKGTGELLRWEAHDGSRRVVPTGRRHVVEDDHGKYRLLSLEREHSKGLAGVTDVASPIMARQVSTVLLPDRLEDVEEEPPVPRTASAPGKLGGDTESEGSPTLRFGMHTGDLRRLCPLLNDSPGLTAEDTVFIVFRILPLTVERNEDTGEWRIVVQRSNRGAVLPTLLHFITPEAREQGYDCKVRFIGLPGVHVKEESEKKKIADLLAQYFCIPVFVDSEVEYNHLDFSVNFLWPVFHSQTCFDDAQVQNLPSNSFSEAKWKGYQALNNAYAEVIAAKGNADTLVWVQDYQLLLVPRYIYLRCPDWHVGLFLHCAFPSSQVISCLPIREEILHSMLSCGLVTFQIFDYLRNFISTCSVLLGAKHTFQKGGMLQVELEHKSAMVSADHFVLPYEHLSRHVGKEEVRTLCESIRIKFKGKTIIGSYDRVDRFAGLCLKVRAFQRFLREYSGYQDKVVLVQYVTICTDNGAEDTAALLRDLEQMALETNQVFQKPGEPPVVTICVEDLDRDRRLAMLQATDVLFDTSINDGLNLVPFQFYAAHKLDKRGVIVVSEFCGCSRVLTGVFKVNPWDTCAIMVALDQALSIEPSEQASRFARDHSYVASQTLVQWVNKNLCELRSSVRQTRGQSLCGHLDYDAVLSAYRSARTRAIFVDNEGTIAAKAGWFLPAASMKLLKQGTPPDEQVLDCLQTLVNDQKNTVVVLSGRDPQCLDRWFGGVQGLGLCAEHGFHWRPPRSLRAKTASPSSQNREAAEEVRWCCLGGKEDDAGAAAESQAEWKAIVLELMKQYVKRVQGSIVECKDSAISWNFRGVGASMVVSEMARELARYLDPRDPNGVMHGYNVNVFCGKGYVEVKRGDVDKGLTITRILEEMRQQLAQPVEFVLCIGDDRTDEDMFEAVAKMFKEGRPEVAKEPLNGRYSIRRRSSSKGACSVKLTSEVIQFRGGGSRSSLGELAGPEAEKMETPTTFTVTVGRKASKAQFFVHDVQEVSSLLKRLSAQTVISSFSRFSSLPNLVGIENDDSDSQQDEDMSENSPDLTVRSVLTTRDGL